MILEPTEAMARRGVYELSLISKEARLRDLDLETLTYTVLGAALAAAPPEWLLHAAVVGRELTSAEMMAFNTLFRSVAPSR